MEEVMDSKLYGAIQFRVLQVAQKWHLSETEQADLLQDTVGHVIQQQFQTAAGARVIADNFLKNWQRRYFRTRQIFCPLTPSIAEQVKMYQNARKASEAIVRAVSRVYECLSPSSRKVVELFWELGCPGWCQVAAAMGIAWETFRDGPLRALKNEFYVIWRRVQDEV